MNDTLRVLAVAVPLLILLIFLSRRMQRGSPAVRRKKEQLKSLHKNEKMFLCDAAEDIGKNLIQFYGEPFGASIRPGMKFTGPDGVEYTIKEVYADDKSPDKPDLEIPDGMTNTTIVIETNTWDWRSFREEKKREKIVALKLR